MSQALLLFHLAEVTAFDIINTSVQVVLALFAVASFIGLVRYVFWTKDMAQTSKRAVEASQQMIEETKAARIAEAVPYVVVELEMRPASFVFVHLVNYGKTLARDVEVQFEPPMLVPIGDTGGEVVPFSAQPVRSLAPGQRIDTALGPGPQILNDPYPQQYRATVSWATDLLPGRQSISIDLDLSVFARVRQGGGGSLRDIAKACNEIKRSIDRAAPTEVRAQVVVKEMPQLELKSTPSKELEEES